MVSSGRGFYCFSGFGTGNAFYNAVCADLADIRRERFQIQCLDIQSRKLDRHFPGFGSKQQRRSQQAFRWISRGGNEDLLRSAMQTCSLTMIRYSAAPVPEHFAIYRSFCCCGRWYCILTTLAGICWSPLPLLKRREDIWCFCDSKYKVSEITGALIVTAIRAILLNMICLA